MELSGYHVLCDDFIVKMSYIWFYASLHPPSKNKIKNKIHTNFWCYALLTFFRTWANLGLGSKADDRSTFLNISSRRKKKALCCIHFWNILWTIHSKEFLCPLLILASFSHSSGENSFLFLTQSGFRKPP